MSQLEHVKSFKEVLLATDNWNMDTKIRLIQELLESLTSNVPTNDSSEALDPSGKYRKGRRWSEIAGAAKYPMVGEDAQEWVTRTRQEGDEQRAKVYERVEPSP